MLTKIDKKSVKVGKRVNTAHVDKVIRNYKQERWANNSKHIGKADSLSVWFSVEELEEFMEDIKKLGGDGVRIYFGAYDNDTSENSLYAGRQTVVFVGTKYKETENGRNNKDMYINTEEGHSILAYNNGTICPPFCKQIDGDGGFGDIGITIVDKGDEGFEIV